MELVNLIAEMFASYLQDLAPLIGFLAGVHILLSWIYSITFRPFDRL